jgi:hypothetical protein
MVEMALKDPLGVLSGASCSSKGLAWAAMPSRGNCTKLEVEM